MEEIKKEAPAAPKFRALETMRMLDVFKRSAKLGEMPSIERRALKDGTSAEVLWLPNGLNAKYPNVRFAWLSPRSSECQRGEKIKKDDEFITRTILTFQQQEGTDTVSAVVTLEGMQKGAVQASTADLADWDD